jgi:hypothetical protein
MSSARNVTLKFLAVHFSESATSHQLRCSTLDSALIHFLRMSSVGILINLKFPSELLLVIIAMVAVQLLLRSCCGCSSSKSEVKFRSVTM